MRKKFTEYTLKKSTEHIFYEASMFYETIAELIHSTNQRNVNILLDAFTIHTRNLFDFFYPRKILKKDDMIVSDFLTKLQKFNRQKIKKKDLIFIVRKVDKQVAHLTYARNRYNSKTKRWPFIEIGRKMYKNLDSFYENLPDSYKKWPYIINIKTMLNNLTWL